MIYTHFTKEAMQLAYEKHKNQYDKGGVPYIFHPYHLAERMDTEEEICVALLHDILEDSEITIEDLKQLGFSERIIKAIEILTHNKKIPYTDYIKKIKTNPLATKIKIEDLIHNEDLTRLPVITNKDRMRREKYVEALALLTDNY